MTDRIDFQQDGQPDHEDDLPIDQELGGDIHGPGQTTAQGGPEIKIRGNVKTGKGLSKKGKKAITFGGAAIVGAVLVGVAMTAHHPSDSSSTATGVQIAGADQAPTPPKHRPVQQGVSNALTASTASTQSSSTSTVTAALAKADQITAGGGQQKLTPREQYIHWLVKQHYKDLEGQYLAARSALVATGNWKHSGAGGNGSAAASGGGGLLPVANSDAAGLPGLPGSASDIMDKQMQYLKQVRKLEALAQGGAGGSGDSASSGAKANQGFLDRQNHQKDSGYLNARLHQARAKTELFAGSTIPAVLVTGINSQLPGMITAQVRTNVYNSLNPSQILIPQGAKLIGVYDSDVQYGQNRVLVAWNRIIYPDGETIALHGMTGADGMGEAGFSQITDNHYWRIFGSAFLISLIGAGAQLSQPQQSSVLQTNSSSQTATAAIAQEMDSVSTNMLNKNLNIAPTLKIRPGYLFNVMVNKTMVLPPYTG